MQFAGFNSIGDMATLISNGTCVVGIGAYDEMAMTVVRYCDLELVGGKVGGKQLEAGFAVNTQKCGVSICLAHM